MKQRKILLVISIFITVTALYLLTTGASILNYNLSSSFNLPAGTLITWLGLLSLSMSIYLGVASLRNPKNWWNKILSYQLKTTIIVAAFWIIISYLLAGNLSFTFTDKVQFQGGQLAMRIFWTINFSLVVVPILVLLSYWILNKFKF